MQYGDRPEIVPGFDGDPTVEFPRPPLPPRGSAPVPPEMALVAARTERPPSKKWTMVAAAVAVVAAAVALGSVAFAVVMSNPFSSRSSGASNARPDAPKPLSGQARMGARETPTPTLTKSAQPGRTPAATRAEPPSLTTSPKQPSSTGKATSAPATTNAPPAERPEPPTIPQGTPYNTLTVGASNQAYQEFLAVDLSPPSSGVKVVTLGFSYEGSGDVARYIMSRDKSIVLLASQGDSTKCRLGSNELTFHQTFSQGKDFVVRLYVAADGRGWVQCPDGSLVEGEIPAQVTLFGHLKRLRPGAEGTLKMTDPQVSTLPALPFNPSVGVATASRGDSSYTVPLDGMNVSVTVVANANPDSKELPGLVGEGPRPHAAAVAFGPG